MAGQILLVVIVCVMGLGLLDWSTASLSVDIIVDQNGIHDRIKRNVLAFAAGCVLLVLAGILIAQFWVGR